MAGSTAASGGVAAGSAGSKALCNPLRAKLRVLRRWRRGRLNLRSNPAMGSACNVAASVASDSGACPAVVDEDDIRAQEAPVSDSSLDDSPRDWVSEGTPLTRSDGTPLRNDEVYLTDWVNDFEIARGPIEQFGCLVPVDDLELCPETETETWEEKRYFYLPTHCAKELGYTLGKVLSPAWEEQHCGFWVITSGMVDKDGVEFVDEWNPVPWLRLRVFYRAMRCAHLYACMHALLHTQFHPSVCLLSVAGRLYKEE